jgi:REP element-mobilizing transposase RayT
MTWVVSKINETKMSVATKHNPLKQHRRSIRMQGFDYSSAGAYFVTLCTNRRECVLNDAVVSAIILDVWESLPERFTSIALDEFVVMPNHVHLLVWLRSAAEDIASVPQSQVFRLVAGGDDVGATVASTFDIVGATNEWCVPAATTASFHPTLGDVIGAFKSIIFTVYLDWIEAHDPKRQAKFWQRNYYEHIVRNERELRAIRRYIRDNPINWLLDRDNLKNIGHLPPPEFVMEYVAEALENMRDLPVP